MNQDTITSLENKLKNLIKSSDLCHQEHAHSIFSDQNNKLTDKKVKGLSRMLSGVASTELLEELLLTPLIRYAGTQVRKDYYTSHSLDEDRHYQLLTRYLKVSFNFEKTRKSFSDYLFYGFFFPLYIALFKKKPLYTLVLIYCFETLSIYFYTHVLEVAKRENLDELAALLELIKKDEMRHIAGVKTQMQIMANEGHPPISIRGRWLIKSLLHFFILDVSMSKWDIHNSSMRKRMQSLGVDTIKFTNELKQNKVDTMTELDNIFNRQS
jgi:hypothetical protein